MENWIDSREGPDKYRRKKNYNLNYGALQMQEVTMPREHVLFMESLARLTAK